MNSFKWKGSNSTFFFIMHGLLKLKFHCFQLNQIDGSNCCVLRRVKHPFKRQDQDKDGPDQNWNRPETSRPAVPNLPRENPGKILTFPHGGCPICQARRMAGCPSLRYPGLKNQSCEAGNGFREALPAWERGSHSQTVTAVSWRPILLKRRAYGSCPGKDMEEHMLARPGTCSSSILRCSVSM